MDLFETGDHQISADGDPDLGLHSIFRIAVESLDSEILFDPFEEKFDLPSAFVALCDRQSRKAKVVGQEGQTLATFGIDETDASEPLGESCFAFGSVQCNGLITFEASSFVHWIGLENMETQVAFRSSNEESQGLVNAEKSIEIDIGSVDHVDAPCLENNLIEEVDIMHFSSADADKNGDRALNLHLGMNFDSGLGLSKMSPWKQRQAQIDSARINSINHLVEIQISLVGGIQTLSFSNENLSQSFVNTPVPVFICVGQIGSGNSSTNTHCVEVLRTPQTGFDVAQTFPECELSEDHTQELIASSHCFTDSGHGMQIDAAVKFFAVEQIQNLGENQSSSVHPLMRLNNSLQRNQIQMRDT